MPKASPFAAFAHKRLSYWSGNLVKIMGFHRFNRLMAGQASLSQPTVAGLLSGVRIASAPSFAAGTTGARAAWGA